VTADWATGMCVKVLHRAIEAARPETEHLFDDPISRHLLPGIWWAFLLPGLRQVVVALVEKQGPGALGNLYGRTRYNDDVVRRALEGGWSKS
jgi:O-methyltransferase involved in polyketide biosynthesis